MVDMDKMNRKRNPRLAKAKEWVDEIREDESQGGIELNDWELEFMESVEGALAENRPLTPPQMEKLEEIWDRV